MKKYTLKMKLKSDTLFASGESFGASIDSDVVFDDYGIPYIPARRIKGLLRESALKIVEMFQMSEIKYLAENAEETISEYFGKPGQEKSTPIYFTNLFIENYEKNKEWIRYLSGEYRKYFSMNETINFFTALRHQTSIDENGVTKIGSLRTFRVLKAPLTLYGEVEIAADSNLEEILSLACLNLRNVGMMRNRGFGEVDCQLINENNDVADSYLRKLEGVCLK